MELNDLRKILTRHHCAILNVLVASGRELTITGIRKDLLDYGYNTGHESTCQLVKILEGLGLVSRRVDGKSQNLLIKSTAKGFMMLSSVKIAGYGVNDTKFTDQKAPVVGENH